MRRPPAPRSAVDSGAVGGLRLASAVRGSVLGVCLVLVVLAGPSRAPAEDAPDVTAAFEICRQADALPSDDKPAQISLLNRGVQLAEAAVAARPGDVRAHLALCCTFGKAVEAAGLSWRSLQRLNRLKAMVETASTLAPNDPDVWVAKGELLRRLPPVLGGDVREAERLYRRALATNPDQLEARIGLAHILDGRDDPDAGNAIALAFTAAQQSGTPRQRAETWQLYSKARR